MDYRRVETGLFTGMRSAAESCVSFSEKRYAGCDFNIHFHNATYDLDIVNLIRVPKLNDYKTEFCRLRMKKSRYIKVFAIML